MILFEPFYENYRPDATLAGATPRYVPLREPDWTIDETELRSAFTDRTRGIVIEQLNNLTGKVFTREELTLIADLVRRYDAVAFTDEIYEHITYDGAVHAARDDPRDGGPHGDDRARRRTRSPAGASAGPSRPRRSRTASARCTTS